MPTSKSTTEVNNKGIKLVLTDVLLVQEKVKVENKFEHQGCQQFDALTYVVE